jgi:DNA-binding NarL/FixJ family response regulator
VDSADSGRSSRVRVLLADDHAITREGTRRVLEAQAEFDVVGEAGNGEEALQLARLLEPDIVVLDISMPGLNGIQVVQALREVCPETRVLILTGYDKEHYAEAVRRLGVTGYLSKTRTSRELVDALRAVQAGREYVRFESDGEPRDNPGPGAAKTPTAREMEVLSLVAKGSRNKEIARRLTTTDRTIQFHMGNLFAKLGATSRTEMVHNARQLGWIG